MAVEPWRTGTVIRIEDETYNTKRYFIKVNELESFNFKAGQFVTLDLPIHEQKNKRWRSYSIASWPDGTNVFELLIVLLEGGAGTTYLFNEVKVGSELTLRGPQGVFTLPENIEKDLFFICTGTGIAPFRSMLNYMQLHNISHKNLYLIFGCRTKKDLLYHEEMKELERKWKILLTCLHLAAKAGMVRKVIQVMCTVCMKKFVKKIMKHVKVWKI